MLNRGSDFYKTRLSSNPISSCNFYISQIDSYSQQNAPGLGVLGLEWLGGTSGGLIVWYLFGTTYCQMGKNHWIRDEPESMFGAFMFESHIIGYIFGSALGTTITGKLLKQRGNFFRSLGWSLGGEVISWGIGWTLGPSPWPYIFIIPQSFAVIGYNLQRLMGSNLYMLHAIFIFFLVQLLCSM